MLQTAQLPPDPSYKSYLDWLCDLTASLPGSSAPTPSDCAQRVQCRPRRRLRNLDDGESHRFWATTTSLFPPASSLASSIRSPRQGPIPNSWPRASTATTSDPALMAPFKVW